MKVSSTSRLRWLMTIIWVAFSLLVAYFLSQRYFSALTDAEQASLMRLAGIANTLALQIDGDAHERLMQKHSLKDDIGTNAQDSDYLRLHDVLQRNFTANMLKSPIYTIVQDEQDKCSFGVTSAEMPYFRHPYNSAPAQLMKKNQEGAMIPRYEDEFGVWLSAFAAVKNGKGQTVALVQVDQHFEEFIMQARANVWKSLAVSALVFVLLFMVLIQVLRPIIRRERQDKIALEEANKEIKRINQQISESFDQIKAIDGFRREMIANLSHDLRTPLSNILGYMDIILQKKEQLSTEVQQRYLHIVLSEAKRMERLVKDLFELSKLESGQVSLELEPFSIAELAQDVLQKYHILAEAKHIKLLTDFDLSSPLVIADLRLIDRVLQNLLDNALRYAHEGGFAKFTIFESYGEVHVKVCNSGDPIPQEHLTQVFDRYFKSSNRKKDSTGLGLTIVKKIMDLHGERIWAEASEGLTTFRFTMKKYLP
jgi:signal transduction histidine kinase